MIKISWNSKNHHRINCSFTIDRNNSPIVRINQSTWIRIILPEKLKQWSKSEINTRQKSMIRKLRNCEWVIIKYNGRMNNQGRINPCIVRKWSCTNNNQIVRSPGNSQVSRKNNRTRVLKTPYILYLGKVVYPIEFKFPKSKESLLHKVVWIIITLSENKEEWIIE